jgi:hypothetical protein
MNSRLIKHRHSDPVAFNVDRTMVFKAGLFPKAIDYPGYYSSCFEDKLLVHK